MRSIRIPFILAILFSGESAGQKLPFQNFGVDKGLIQSQVLAITQDQQRHLWIGTFGGLDRFDGSSFQHFTKTEGLNSSGITALYNSADGKIWAGTFKGISSYDGTRFINYPVEGKSSSFNFNVITEDDNGKIWAFNLQHGLFNFREQEFVKVKIPMAGAVPTCIYKTPAGDLLINIHQQGIFQYQKGNWKKKVAVNFLATGEYFESLQSAGDVYYGLTNQQRLLKFSANELLAGQQITADNFGSSCIDSENNIWVATNKGVMLFNGNDLTHLQTYTAASGLSDNYILSLFTDKEHNIWLGSDGDGIFKYSRGAFAKFDRYNGLPGNIVMGVAKDSVGNFYIGTREGGLVNYTTDKTIIQVDYSPFSKAGINSLAVDSKNNLFIGTLDNKLLLYNGKTFRQLSLTSKTKPFVNAIVPYGNKLWVATSTGCFYRDGETFNKVENINEIVVGVLPLRENEVFIATTSGVYFFQMGKAATKISNPSLGNADVNCLVSFGDFILAGTIGDGIYYWNRKTDEVYQCDAKKGLADNNVFSIFPDSKGNVWVGTGTGIQQVIFNESTHSFTVKKFSKADGYENSENNLNTIAEDKFGRIWIGTTAGAFVFNPSIKVNNAERPYIVIRDVQSPGFSGDTGLTKENIPWSDFPVSPELPYSKNSISFTVKGIYMKDPDGILYSHQLVGVDTGFSLPTHQHFFNYQSLEPGHYVFKVKAIAPDGSVSQNIAIYPFSISTPFHKTKWFLFLLMVGLVLTGIFIQLALSRARQRKRQQLQTLREEEQEKVRQRTSEDFHDELGNKLTRISLLADILQRKVLPTDTEKTNLIRQIRENVLALYTGTKDVIWSLSPGSDNFLEIVKRIEQFGLELFHDSTIEFSMNGINVVDPAINLPSDYSRNIIMIFKELLNNSLRHAAATAVVITLSNPEDGLFILSMADNGSGFDSKNTRNGNGLHNIQRRAGRIGAKLDIRTGINKGTTTNLVIKIPSNGG